MERLLHYVWKYRLYGTLPLVTTDGLPVSIIDQGLLNIDSGPDFSNAKILIGGTMWAGAVELHDKSSDWFIHHHYKDRAFDAVILHVVLKADAEVRRTNGELIPQLILPVPDGVWNSIDWLLARDVSLPCLERIGEIDKVHLASWMDALLGERLDRKTSDIFRLLDQYNEDWNEMFYILLTRSFGFGVNNDAFEWLAKSLPARYIRKQRDSETQVEALFFGQAGMLEERESNQYYSLLKREYQFLRHKFGLKPLDDSLFKNLRIRPYNFPRIKLAQLAAIWYRYDTLFSMILNANDPKEIKEYFRVPSSNYWNNKIIGDNALNVLLINAVVPSLFAYGVRKSIPEYCDRAIHLLESIPPEQNHIVREFERSGVHPRNACDTQSIIQLRREYCDKRKCLYCRIGFRLLKRCGN